MTIIEASRKVLASGYMLLRARRDDTSVPQQFDVKEAFTGKKKGWFYLDSFTSSAIVAVHDALNEQNREKYLRLPLDKLVNVTWKMCK